MHAKVFGIRPIVSMLGAVTVMSAVLLPLVAERAAPREIVIVARDMAFFLEGQTTVNPVIRVRRGEQISLRLRNEDIGMTHDFAINDWGVATRQLRGVGVDRVSFTVPDISGSTEYLCSPHSAAMRGIIQIE